MKQTYRIINLEKIAHVTVHAIVEAYGGFNECVTHHG